MIARGHRASSHRSWILAAAMVVIAACSSPAQTPSPEPTASFDPNASAWDNVLARIGPDGEVDAELAMDAFAVAFAPLPGRPEPTGTASDIEDGTLAVDWILRFWDDLTPDQQSFADALIHGRQPGASPAAAVVNALAPANRQPRVLLAAEPTDWPSLLDAMAEQVAAKFGRVYTGTIDVEVVLSPIDVPAEDWNAAAWALSQDAAGDQVGPAQSCTIYIAPTASTWTGAEAASLMAHELFHCFDYDLGQIADHHQVPAWVKEGAATWAAADIVGGDKYVTGWWGHWLATPDKILYSRAYDAIGIYGLLQLTGDDPWSIMDELLTAAVAGNEAAFAVLYGVGSEFFMDTWGPRYWDDSGYGPFWIYGGAGFSTALTAATPSQVVAGPGTTKTVPAPFRAANHFWVEAVADVVVISAEGSNGLAKSIETGKSWEIDQVPPLCTLEGGCVCPGGSSGAGFEYVPLGSQVIAGATGNPVVGLITITGYSIDDFCKEPDHPDQGPCVQICPTSNGDPHLTTVDGREYDFQAAGEFTLLRSADSSLEVQARQEPFADSDWVSINTAVAMGMGDDRVALYLVGQVRLLVNGVEVDQTAETFAGELDVTPIEGGFKIEASDGTIVWLLGVGEWGVNVVVAPSDELRASGVGLLGPVGTGDLPALPDGAAVNVGDDARGAIYDVLGPAWAVTAEDSLFDYETGQGPDTFRDASIPAPDGPLSFSGLPIAQQQTGLLACASVDDQALREQCAFDVAVTGDEGFVTGYESTDSITTTGLVAIPTPGPDVTQGPLPGEDECGSLSDEQILAVTGHPVMEMLPGIPRGGAYTGGCYWTLDAGGLNDIAWIYLNVKSPGGRASFDENLADWPDLEHVPNLGDDAVLDVANSMVAVKGDRRVDIQYVDIYATDEQGVLIELVRAALAHY